VGFDLRALAVAFGLVFLAELGDKTQLTTLMLAAQTRALLPVFFGAAAALVLTSLLGVIFGEAITRLIPAQTIRLASGAAFVLIGGLMLLGRG
jgi:putative Ca2+/H+ antiporter (TMEM165/GDT1 family)